MANEEQLKVLRKGVEAWNAWREKNPDVIVGLSSADLTGLDLSRANLSSAFLSGANLFRANLAKADLSGADLTRADLSEANLSDAILSLSQLVEADLSGANLAETDLSGAGLTKTDLSAALLTGANLTGAFLSKANLNEADLSGAHLSGAHLSPANLSRAILFRADLTGADLVGANLWLANLSGANLSGADLSGAQLYRASLSNAKLDDALLKGATLGATVIAGTQICRAEGLEQVWHFGPSIVDVSTILSQERPLPEVFLRGVGLPDEFIVSLLMRWQEPAGLFYSCFIVYASADEGFAERLYKDFQAAGIRCWKWDHNVKTGERIWAGIDRAIRMHDRLVVILSADSLNDDDVIEEIREACDEEAKRGPNKLVIFPVATDDYWKSWNGDLKQYLTERGVADAKGWDIDAHLCTKVVNQLIKDLKGA